MSNEKIEAFWENATADDVAKIANTRKSIQARFRDEDNEDWVDCLLAGWKLSRHLPGARWIDADGAMWNHCQVYREPSWYADKPDPGPGWRLLGKFPDEELKTRDECFGVSGEWGPSCQAKAGGHQVFGMWYRRRIEPKFAVGQTVKVVGPKVSDAKQWDSKMARHVGTLQTIKYIEGFANPPEIFYGVYGIDSRTFREDYLEPVEPEPKHYVLRVGDSVETPRGHLINVVSSSAEQRIYSLDAGDKLTLPNGQTITITAKGFEVTQ
jgi:hypothetical protein